MPHHKKILAALWVAASLAVAPPVRADDIPDAVAAKDQELERGGVAVTGSPHWPDALHQYAAMISKPWPGGPRSTTATASCT